MLAFIERVTHRYIKATSNWLYSSCSTTVPLTVTSTNNAIAPEVILIVIVVCVVLLVLSDYPIDVAFSCSLVVFHVVHFGLFSLSHWSLFLTTFRSSLVIYNLKFVHQMSRKKKRERERERDTWHSPLVCIGMTCMCTLRRILACRLKR